MSAPADPVSNFLVQHNLLPYLLSFTAISTLSMVRKRGSAVKKVISDTLRGLLELHGDLCDLLVGCGANWYRVKALRAENNERKRQISREDTRSLAQRAGAD